MVFSSMIFLWMFLPIMFIGYYILPVKCRNVFLLLGSLIFYAWGEPRYILLMIFSIVINWILGIGIEKLTFKRKNILFIADIVINIGILIYYKYFIFLANLLLRLIGLPALSYKISLPIGISFFTFQIMSYIIDLYRGQYKAQKNIINIALYISFFPQLIAGPIVKYKDIEEQIQHRDISIEKIASGIRRFIYGLAKKVILSNTIACSVDIIFSMDNSDLTGILAWLGAILYTFQIYYDFSGYSDMAIGLGKMFGFDFQENFNYPYCSRNIQEFWQRWHMSLGSWFREYLYIPLGGNRKGKAHTYFNLFIVFLATGLWHGANLTFLVWGIYHGIICILERMGLQKILEKNRVITHVYTLLVIVFGWVVFRADSLFQAKMFLYRMIFPWKYFNSTVDIKSILDYKILVICCFAAIGCGIGQLSLVGVKLYKRIHNSYFEILYCALLFLICISMLASNTYNPFIYFRF